METGGRDYQGSYCFLAEYKIKVNKYHIYWIGLSYLKLVYILYIFHNFFTQIVEAKPPYFSLEPAEQEIVAWEEGQVLR